MRRFGIRTQEISQLSMTHRASVALCNFARFKTVREVLY